MKHVISTIALAGCACAASAQPAESGRATKSFAGQDVDVVALASYPAGVRTFNEVRTGAGPHTSTTNSQITAGATPRIPEPRTYALLLAGLGAIVFVAGRRRRP